MTGRYLAATLMLGLFCGSASAQTASSSSRPFEIVDNSFLVEEAFNQPSKVFQNIFGIARQGGRWDATFTQEWPLHGETHQFSYTIPLTSAGPDPGGLGDVLINYRLQVWKEAGRRPALAPRLSVIVPTGDDARGLGSGVVGLQVNIPASRQFGDWYFHGNAGVTWLPGEASTPSVAASAIYRARPMLNLLIEGVTTWEDERAFTISPGVRGGWNLGDRQIVLGFAVPTTIRGGQREAGIFLYASYELPFRR